MKLSLKFQRDGKILFNGREIGILEKADKHGYLWKVSISDKKIQKKTGWDIGYYDRSKYAKEVLADILIRPEVVDHETQSVGIIQGIKYTGYKLNPNEVYNLYGYEAQYWLEHDEKEMVQELVKIVWRKDKWKLASMHDVVERNYPKLKGMESDNYKDLAEQMNEYISEVHGG